MGDLISRKALIDLLKQMRKDGDMIPWEGKDVFARIRKLPPAQPEIIRCKDCAWWQREWSTDGKSCYYCPMIDTNTDAEFYCADAEREAPHEP